MDCSCNLNEDAVCTTCGQHRDPSTYTQYEKVARAEKIKDATILAELSSFRFSDEIKLKITLLYQKATGGKTKRNTPRRAIIFCCIVSVCKDNGLTFDEAAMQKTLDIKVKDINKAIKDIEPNIKTKPIDIGIEDVIKRMIYDLNLRDECLRDILIILEKCKRDSMLFNSAKNETLAAGLMYYYLETNLNEFNRELFFEKVKISTSATHAVADEIKQLVSL